MRGPVIATTRHQSQRNAIGGCVCVCRAVPCVMSSLICYVYVCVCVCVCVCVLFIHISPQQRNAIGGWARACVRPSSFPYRYDSNTHTTQHHPPHIHQARTRAPTASTRPWPWPPACSTRTTAPSSSAPRPWPRSGPSPSGEPGTQAHELKKKRRESVHRIVSCRPMTLLHTLPPKKKVGPAPDHRHGPLRPPHHGQSATPSQPPGSRPFIYIYICVCVCIHT